MRKLPWSKLLPPGAIVAVVAVVLFAGFGPMRAQPDHLALEASPSPSLGYDPRVLLKEFQEAQQSEMQELISKEKAAAKNLKAQQSAKQKDFDQREKVARRKFFADPHPGAEKRAYMHDLLARRDAFRKDLADERARAKSESDERVQALRDMQADHLSKFKDSIERGERPADSLWPQPSN